MKFRIALWLLGKFFIRANKKNKLFQNNTRHANVIIQICAKSDPYKRLYIFTNGTVQTSKSYKTKPDCSISFINSRYGFSILTSHNKHAFTQGLLDEKITIEGDLSTLFWFRNLIGVLRSAKKNDTRTNHVIGFIGTGFIGAPMARRLIQNGFTIKAYDINSAAMEQIARDGAIACASLSDCSDAEVIIIMVSTVEQVATIVSELCAILPRRESIPLLVMSTISPDDIEQVRIIIEKKFRHDIDLLDAPVSGTPALAEAGLLSIMVGGPKKIFDKVKPILETLGDVDKIFHTGSLGSGLAMKLINNIIAFSAGLAVKEAMLLGIEKGLDPDYIARIINAGSGKNFITEQWPLAKHLISMMLHDTTYHASSALFTIGLKDLITAKKWAHSEGHIACIDAAIEQINNLSEEELIRQLKMLIKDRETVKY